MLGTVDSSGLYTAPSTVPTPYTVKVAATSVTDATKSASSPLIVAGTISSVSQFVTAANGGTITLPDNSYVTVPSGVLPSDVNASLTEVSYLQDQPSNTSIQYVGPALILTFQSRLQFFDITKSGNSFMVSSPSIAQPRLHIPTLPIHFNISAIGNDVSQLVGSVPIVDLKNSLNTGTSIVFGATGSFISNTETVAADVGTDLLNAATDAGQVIDSITVSAANILGIAVNVFTAPSDLELSSQNTWTSYSKCPTGKTMVLVHGMLSDAQTAFPNQTAINIKQRGGYDGLVAFDYDWTQTINASGAQLATFINSLAQCGNSIDIEAHSEGVAVTMSALSQVSSSVTLPLVKHFFALGGPFMGTPMANDSRLFSAFVLSESSINLGSNVVLDGLSDLLTRPFIADLQVSTPGSNDVLDSLRNKLSTPSINNSPQFFVVAGSYPHGILVPTAQLMTISGVNYSDGFIPLASALAFQPNVNAGAGLKVYPFAPFAMDDHLDLTTDTSIIASTTSQATNAFLSPSLILSSIPSCTDPLVCVGPMGTDYYVSGTGYSTSASNSSYEQYASGQVISLSPFITNTGAISQVSWQGMATTCATPEQTVVFFASNSAQPSNAVTEEVGTGNCVVSGPTAHFTMTGQSMTVNDGGTLTLTVASGGSASVSFSSTSTQGSAAITSYVWKSNGMQICSSSSCTVPFNASSDTITLTVTDSNGKVSMATGYIVVSTQQAAQTPSATTGSATAISTNSATLNGTVNPNGADTHFYFEYGTSSLLSSYSSTGIQDLGSGTSASGISANIASLNTGTQYYFRVVAYNSSGTTNGLIVPFSTASAAQTGPTAHFTMTGQSQNANDGGTLSLSITTGGSVSANFTSTSTPGSAPITTYVWKSNGTQYCTNASTCGLTFTGAGSATITLTVTDQNGKMSTATGTVVVTVPTVTLSVTGTTCHGSAPGSVPEIDLSFTVSGGTSSDFDIYRDGILLYPDNTGTTYLSYGTPGNRLTPGQNYSYYVVVHLAAGGTATSNTASAIAPSNCH